MECIVGQQSGLTVTARRNNSLTSSDRILAFGFIAVVSLGIAAAFAWLGAWLILPFAGIEVLVLFFAFRCIERHARDYERLTISGDLLQIEIAEVKSVQQVQFNRWWAQVIYEPDGSRLALRSHGREVEFGRHLTEDERMAVAGTLRQRLRSR
jgi:uncharacterized membrane protein